MGGVKIACLSETGNPKPRRFQRFFYVVGNHNSGGWMINIDRPVPFIPAPEEGGFADHWKTDQLGMYTGSSNGVAGLGGAAVCTGGV